MADITVTATTVLRVSGQYREYTSGATIIAGKLVYLDENTGTVKLADADAAASAEIVGIALNQGYSGQPITVQTSGLVQMTATGLTVGQVYVASTTAGGIAPYSDLASGDYVSVFGVGTASNQITIDMNVSGVAKP